MYVFERRQDEGGELRFQDGATVRRRTVGRQAREIKGDDLLPW
jgi:hypothetical protein